MPEDDFPQTRKKPSTTVRIAEDTYRLLMKQKHEMEDAQGRTVTYDEVIVALVQGSRKPR